MEAFLGGKWGAVCGRSYSSSWNASNAQVVCRQLGLGWTAAFGFTGSDYPQYVDLPGPGTNGSLPFLMSWAMCNGTEARLQDCGYFTGLVTGYGGNGCDGQDAGEEKLFRGWVSHTHTRHALELSGSRSACLTQPSPSPNHPALQLTV